MHPEDIQLAREEIAKATGSGAYMPMPFALLRDAIETIERQRWHLEEIKGCRDAAKARELAKLALKIR
jgi:hypothetical protein